MRFRDAASAFIRHCQSIRKLSPHTIRAYELDLARFSQFLGRRANVAACDKSKIHDYVRHLFDDRELKESSVKRHLATLRSLFRWLEEDEEIEDPFRGARIRIRMPKRLPRVIARADLKRLLVHERPHAFIDLTAYVATELLFATGMRVSELASLLDAAVDLDDGTITIIGKGNRQRRVFVPDELKSLLRDYRIARAAHDAPTFLVNSRGAAASPQLIRRLIREHGERSAVRDRVTPHMFRHSVATYLLEEGVDIRYVQKLLGHRSISTTEIYTHVADAALKVRITERHPRRGIVASVSSQWP
ncbi:MAG TPA: tyrosine-type recombinase/integrase [Thermoanaerobaculia bacterium]|nr:tyrosine-type recombinase/integrase [Thermoanaerobaculia bacterium]